MDEEQNKEVLLNLYHSSKPISSQVVYCVYAICIQIDKTVLEPIHKGELLNVENMPHIGYFCCMKQCRGNISTIIDQTVFTLKYTLKKCAKKKIYKKIFFHYFFRVKISNSRMCDFINVHAGWRVARLCE